MDENAKMTAKDEIIQTGLLNAGDQGPRILFIEPFYGGSHKVFIETLMNYFTGSTLVSLPAKKWHWRARCGALMVLNLVPQPTTEEVLFCSSVLNLSELLGIRPDLQRLKKVVYFHENQLVYPVRHIKQRDVQYPYNQIMTCLAADIVFFNSHYNMTSFLDNIRVIVKMMPDARPKDLREAIEGKCKVLYFPLKVPPVIGGLRFYDVLHIVWPHRWEHDKGPNDLFKVLTRLQFEKVPFRVSILGESSSEIPQVFLAMKELLSEEIIQFGYLDCKEVYYRVLNSAHVVVSTAKHEFFGVAMLEAVSCGCYPLAPNSLVYPEIYPGECLYSDLDDLFMKLKIFCLDIPAVFAARESLDLNMDKFSCDQIVGQFVGILKAN